METTPQMFLLGNQPMPIRFAVKESFKLANAKAYSYLLISADTSDGVQELFLYRKVENEFKLLARRKLPVQFNQGIAQKMTGVIFQQVWYCRQNPDVPLKNFLHDFGRLFNKSELSMKLLKELENICTQQGISYASLYSIVSQLLEKCGFNYLTYKKYLMQSMKHHPMRILFKSALMDWLSFCQLASELLEENKEWKSDDYPMLYFASYGSSYLTALICYAQSTESDKEAEIPNTIAPEKDTKIFQLTEEIFRSTQQNMKAFGMRFSSISYETKMNQEYVRLQKMDAQQRQSEVVPLYAEKVLCLPVNSAIYVGKWDGKVREISSVEGAEGYLMPAPLSEKFSALVASGKAKIIEEKWTKQPDGWLFSMKYTYKDRDASRPYFPLDKYYSQEQLVFVDKFPEILVTQKKEKKDLFILAKQSKYSVGMSEAVFDGSSLKLTPPEKMPYNYMLYFKLFDSNQKFMGQFSCNLTPNKKGGN